MPSTRIKNHARPRDSRRLFRLASATAWAVALLALLILLLANPAQRARAQEGGVSGADVSALAVDGVTVTLGIRTPGSTTDRAATTANNGDRVLYRIVIQNRSGGTLQDMGLEAVLPTSGFDNVECDCTTRKSTVITRTNAVGDQEPVTVTRELGWDVGLVGNSATRIVTFTVQVVGQAGGPPIENTALAFFKQNGVQRSGVTNRASLSIVPDVPAGAVDRDDYIPSTPNWFSNDQGGTLDMDWADLDNDGDLDLALASTVGLSVYVSDGGLLEQLWSDPQARTVFGVRWIDVNNDGAPELVAVGTPTGSSGGANYVFRYDPTALQAPDRFGLMPNGLFPTAEQLTRIETGRFNDDDLPDLLLSVNAISAECPVFILYNEGANLFRGTPKCVSGAGSAALSAADMDLDGELDAALGLFPNQIRVFLGSNGVLTQTNPAANTVFVDAPSYFLPYDFAWGDIDRDGDLDLAASFPLQRQVRIYRNLVRAPGVNTVGPPGFELVQPILPTSVFLTPYALEWGDIDRDGGLDLIVADANPKIYWNTLNAAQPFLTSADYSTEIPLPGQADEVWRIRAIDQGGDGTLELAIANRDGPSLLLANYAPALDRTLVPILDAGPAGSVAWGDVNNDGLNDLLLGAPAGRNSSRAFLNSNGSFSFQRTILYSADVVGRQTALLGDLDANSLRSAAGGRLDVVLATPAGLSIARDGGDPQATAIPGLVEAGNPAALGDADGDGDLDLAVAPPGGPIYLLQNNPGQSPAQRLLTIPVTLAGITGLAWGDLDGDHYLDLAVASGSGVQVLINNSDLTFSPVPVPIAAPCAQRPTQALAWADFDADGDQDLALANSPGPSCLLRNQSVENGRVPSAFAAAQAFGPESGASTLDWGDWDNDGDPDLAVGYRGGPARVYANVNRELALLWESLGAFQATGVRFGDLDGDGDLDLALAHETPGLDSGIFENRTVAPAHYLPETQVQALPNQSLYVSVSRPGVTRSAYDYSTSEILAGPRAPTVTVEYRIFDPDGGDTPRTRQLRVLVTFSLDGGGRWNPATPMPGQSDTVTATLTRAGEDHTFLWNALADGAIGEQALVRVAVVNPSDGVLLQQAVGVGVSPPFQVRATTCVWPANPRILATVGRSAYGDGDTVPIPEGERTVELTLLATLGAGSGSMAFDWEWGPGLAGKSGQRVRQRLPSGVYEIEMTARGQACPERRIARRTIRLTVGLGGEDVFLPLVSGAASTSTVAAAGAAPAAVEAAAGPPAPFGLVGEEAGTVARLAWQGGQPGLETRLYMLRSGALEPELAATLPGDAGRYEGPLVCGAAYMVAFADGSGETLSAESWLALPCQEEAAP